MASTQDESETLIGKIHRSFSAASYARSFESTCFIPVSAGSLPTCCCTCFPSSRRRMLRNNWQAAGQYFEISESDTDDEVSEDSVNEDVSTKKQLDAFRDGVLPPITSGVGDVIETDKVHYAWQDVNVFVAAPTASQRRGWGRWGRREEGVRPMKHILKNVSGVAHPGELLAIMGSSGAGKTTLLNALTFRSASDVKVTGRSSLNGVPVSGVTLAGMSAYVQQDDLFVGTLTVREHLVFHALVRMDRGIPYKQRMLRVDQVISELALTKCQHTVIGVPGRVKGVSGGERKRLSFASEVLTDPPLMFCDEPTTGLDSFIAQSVVAVLRNLASKGKTVVCTIHQPSSQVFTMFDKVLLMAEGRVAFLGTSFQASAFFSELGVPCPRNYNPADFFVQLLAVAPAREAVCRETIERVCDAFEQTATGVELAAQAHITQPAIQAKMALPEDGRWGDEGFGKDDDGDPRPRSPYKASWWMQFRAVLWRSWLTIVKDPAIVRVRMLQTAMSAIFVGVLYFGTADHESVMNISGALYVFLSHVTIANVMLVSTTFGAELPVFKREHHNGMYRADVYFLCKTLADLPVFLVLPVLFTGIAYYLVGLNPEVVRFLIAVGVVLLVSNAATSFGYLVTCASSSLSMALTIGPPIIEMFHFFGGYFLNVASIPIYVKWLSYFSWFIYGFEALLINQWEGVDYIDCSNATIICPENGHLVLEMYSFDESHFVVDLWGLLALIVGFRVAAFFALLARMWRTD